MLFQISDVSEVDSGQYTCQLVGEDSEEMRERKTEGRREEVEINVFHREKEEEEEKEMGEDNWKIFYEEKKGDTEDMSRKVEEGGFREREAHLRESERGGGGEVGRSRVIFQKFQNSDLLNDGDSGDTLKEVDSRTRHLSQSSSKSTRNLTEPLLSTESMTDVTELSDGSRNLSRRPTLFVTSVASSVCKSCVFVFLCFFLLFRTLTIKID